MSFETSARRLGDPLPGRRLHHLAEHGLERTTAQDLGFGPATVEVATAPSVTLPNRPRRAPKAVPRSRRKGVCLRREDRSVVLRSQVAAVGASPR